MKDQPVGLGFMNEEGYWEGPFEVVEFYPPESSGGMLYIRESNGVEAHIYDVYRVVTWPLPIRGFDAGS
jgi:hypothetical protein